MQNKFIRPLTSLFIFLLAVVGVKGQARLTGSITGESHTPVAGVTVHLLNTDITTLSDSTGHFSIRRLTPGRYTVELSASGYTTLARTTLLSTGENAMDFEMASSLLQLDAVTVTADKKEELQQ